MQKYMRHSITFRKIKHIFFLCVFENMNLHKHSQCNNGRSKYVNVWVIEISLFQLNSRTVSQTKNFLTCTTSHPTSLSYYNNYQTINIVGQRIFMKIYIFVNRTKEIKFKCIFVLTINNHKNYFTSDILHIFVYYTHVRSLIITATLLVKITMHLLFHNSYKKNKHVNSYKIINAQNA